MISKIVKAVLAYIAIAGTVTLSLFMLEEAFQTAMFGTWPAQDANQWGIVKDGTNLMEKINGTMKIINCWTGWVQPLAFVSYRAYGKSADFYVRSLRSKVFAHAPELFVGEEVEFLFTPKSQQKERDGLFERWVCRSGKVSILSEEPLELGASVSVAGILGKQEPYGLVVCLQTG